MKQLMSGGIVSQPLSDEGKKNWDRVFPKRKAAKPTGPIPDWCCQKCGRAPAKCECA
jgi:hypothetical protein